jgi:hypothetical protein
VRVETVIVATTVVVMMVVVEVASAMKEVVQIVVRVRKETDHREIDRHVHRVGIVVRVRKETDHREIDRKGIDRHVRREIGRRVHKGIVVRVRKETDHREIDRKGIGPREIDHRVHHVRREIGRHVHKESVRSVSRVQIKRPRRRLRWILPLQPRQRHHHHQLHQRLILVPLRASRGRKPCYWHRHVQNIAASIAVA